MNKNCLITFHLSTGDNFTSYAMVLNYYDNYDYIHIFCLFRNRKFIKQLYKNYPKIIIHILSENYNNHDIPGESITDLKSTYNNNIDIIKTGTAYNSWYQFTTYDHLFWRKFYMQANLDYNIRYNYNNIDRDNLKENLNYNELIKKYGNRYIFIHDHRNIFYNHYDKRKDITVNSDLPIFHPNFNYYCNNDSKYLLWEEKFYYDNILDYCKIIENAEEIHINDSSFSCLCPYLDLSMVKKKYIYTNLNYIDYHKSFSDWIIINY